MSNVNYLDGDREREILEALRFQTLEVVAAKAGYSPEHLTRLLGLPATQPVTQQADDQSCDLWRADDLQEVL